MAKKKQAEPIPDGMFQCKCGDVLLNSKAVHVDSSEKKINAPTCEACYQRSFRESDNDRAHPKYNPDRVSAGKYT